MFIGGYAYGETYQSVEFWSAADPEQGSCVLNDYPRRMSNGPTVNLVSGQLVACNGESCDIYRDGLWQHLQNTTATRYYHSSATTEDAVLLIGGDSYTTEWIAVDGSPAQQGLFTIRHGWGHCTIQISDDIIVMTGGGFAEDIITQYQLSDGTETPLTSMGQPRYRHACGAYKDTDDQQVRGIGFVAANTSLSYSMNHINFNGDRYYLDLSNICLGSSCQWWRWRVESGE